MVSTPVRDAGGFFGIESWMILQRNCWHILWKALTLKNVPEKSWMELYPPTPTNPQGISGRFLVRKLWFLWMNLEEFSLELSLEVLFGDSGVLLEDFSWCFLWRFLQELYMRIPSFNDFSNSSLCGFLEDLLLEIFRGILSLQILLRIPSGKSAGDLIWGFP